MKEQDVEEDAAKDGSIFVICSTTGLGMILLSIALFLLAVGLAICSKKSEETITAKTTVLTNATEMADYPDVDLRPVNTNKEEKENEAIEFRGVGIQAKMK